MASDATHARQLPAALHQADHDAPDRALIDTGAAEAESGLRGFTMVPPYPTSSIQRLATGDELGGTEADAGVTGVLQRRKGAGRPLDRVDSDRFGAGFGQDLSGVRVHTDGEADSVARSVQSVAFTYGRDVYFSRGSYAPGTDSGDHLLAHELAHVVQGSSGRWAASGSGSGSGVQIGRADDPAEAAADVAADRVMAQMRRGDRPDPVVVGSLPAVQGEPIARTVRRAGIKSLAKKVKGAFKGKKKTHPKGHPSSSPTLGGASIADLKAASDAAHTARQQPPSSSGPTRKRRSSTRSSRSHRNDTKADHSGEGSESESEEKIGYSTDLGLGAFGTAYSLPPVTENYRGDEGSESDAEEKSGHHGGPLRSGSFRHAYSGPPMTENYSSEGSESDGEEKQHHGYSNPAMLGQLLGANSYAESESESEEKQGHGYLQFAPWDHGNESEGSESDSEEKGGHYNHDLDLGLGAFGTAYTVPQDAKHYGEGSESEGEEKQGHHYSNPAMLGHLYGSDSDSESSEDEGDEKVHYDTDLDLPGTHYTLPGQGIFGGDSSWESSESEDEDVFGSEEKEPGTHYTLPGMHYTLPGQGIFGGDSSWESSESEDEDDDIFGSEEQKAQPTLYTIPPPGGFDFDGDSSEDSESEDDEIFGSEERKKSYTTDLDFEPEAPRQGVVPEAGEGPEAEGEERAPVPGKKGHRAFLTRGIHGSYANERNGLNADQEGAIRVNAMGRLERVRAAQKVLAEGKPVAEAISKVNIRMFASLVNQLKAAGDDVDKAQVALDAALADVLEFFRRQEIPLNDDGSLGDISDRKVHYDTEDEQKASTVTVSGGKLVRSTGEPVDTGNSSTFFTGNGAEIFVANDRGEMHMSSHKIGKYHHSSLLAAADVSVGGEIEVKGGQIKWLSNKSGHYMPTQEHLVQFVHWLGKDGVDLKSVTIKDGFGFQGGMTADKFVAGVDEHGASEASMGFHAVKLQVLIELYEDEFGDEVEDFLESEGFDVFDGIVLNARPGSNASKEVISALKRKFGEPKGAKEKA